MKAIVPLIGCLVALAVLAAGCTSTPPPATPTPTTVATTTVPTSIPTVVFTLGEKYLDNKYSFTSEKDVYKEQFRATNEPWGVEFTVNPTHEDPQYTWFEITLTQLDTGKVDTFGYGRTFSYEKHQMHPMYASGPYTVELKGNRVSVTVNIAKRKP